MTPPPLIERQVIALDRLRLLALGYYISGAIGAALVSFFLIHFFLFLGLSFIPASQWNTPPPSFGNTHYASPAPFPGTSQTSNDAQGPPAAVFRIVAGVVGFIILCGWTLGALTIYAGRCIKKRRHKVFIYVMAGINCIWIPYGTVLGIATILLFQWPEVQAQFEISPSDAADLEDLKVQDE
jgi:hypothetical protein